VTETDLSGGDILSETMSMGLSLLTDVFGFEMPRFDARQTAGVSRDMQALQTADERLLRFSSALFGAANEQASNEGLAREKPDLEAIRADVMGLSPLSDEHLISHANDTFCLNKIDLMSTFHSDSYAWVKINHGWWEQVSGYALESSRVAPVRDRWPIYYERTSSQDVIFRSLQLIARPSDAAGSFDFVNNNIVFAISFNAGRFWNEEITIPLPPHIRGAMLGAAPFFRAATGGKRFNVADGAAAKKIAYTNRLGDFCALVRAASDLVVFIVPDHLKTIGMVDFEGDESHIIVPSRTIHELWPVTLAYVAGEFAKVVSEYQRVTVFVQAGAISLPISLLIMHLVRRKAAKVRLYDLGQVLDLAEPEGHRTHVWAKNLEAFPEFARAHVGSFTLR
jgi:hypothetical protein